MITAVEFRRFMRVCISLVLILICLWVKPDAEFFIKKPVCKLSLLLNVSRRLLLDKPTMVFLITQEVMIHPISYLKVTTVSRRGLTGYHANFSKKKKKKE